MKGRNIFIIFLVTVILGTSALASLILVDGTYPIDLIKSGIYLGTGPHFNVHDESIGRVSKLKFEDLSFPLSIKKGDNRLVVSSNNEKLDPSEYFDYTNNEGVMEFKTRSGAGQGLNENFYITLYLEDPSSLDVDLGKLSGVIDIYSTIKSLKVEYLSGILNSYTLNSYDINIMRASGIVTFEFEQIDANIRIGKASGIVDIEGVDTSIFDTDLTYEKIFGSGKNNISFEEISGIITISQDDDN